MKIHCRILIILSLILLTKSWEIPNMDNQDDQRTFNSQLMTNALDRSIQGQIFNSYKEEDDKAEAYDPTSIFGSSLTSTKSSENSEEESNYALDAPPITVNQNEWTSIRQEKPSSRLIKHRQRQDQSTVAIKNDMRNAKKQERQGITSTQKKLISRIASAGYTVQPTRTNYNRQAAPKVAPVAEQIKMRRADVKEPTRKKIQNMPAEETTTDEGEASSTKQTQQSTHATVQAAAQPSAQPPVQPLSKNKMGASKQKREEMAKAPIKKPELKVKPLPTKPQELKLKAVPQNQAPQPEEQTANGYYRVDRDDGSYYLIPASNKKTNDKSKTRQYLILP